MIVDNSIDHKDLLVISTFSKTENNILTNKQFHSEQGLLSPFCNSTKEPMAHTHLISSFSWEGTTTCQPEYLQADGGPQCLGCPTQPPHHSDYTAQCNIPIM